MTTPFMGEIRPMSFNFAPQGWAQANGQFLPINQNQALFSLFGTMYGGNGQTTFALPDLRGRVPIHFGGGFTQGERGGEENHTVLISEMPAHLHIENATSVAATAGAPSSARLLAQSTGAAMYASATNLAALAPALAPVGGSQPHNNMQPYSVLNFCVALQGVFPSRN